MQTGRYYVVDQIEQAFYDLMKEKDYTNITVTDIIKRAQVSRASFYRHFNSGGKSPASIGGEFVTNLTQWRETSPH